MRTPSRSTLAALACTLLVGLAVGCGNARHAAGVTIHVSDWGGASADPNMARFQRTIMDHWRHLHPDIHIRWEHIPGSTEYVSKMLTAFVAGTEPDVMSLDASSAAVFIDNGCLKDLAPLARRDHVDLGAYWPNVLAMEARGRRLYALPGDFTPMVMFYNKKLFQRAHLPYPQDDWTWADFLNDCRALTVWPRGALHPTQYGFLAQNWMPAWIPFIWQNGGDVLSPNGKRAEGYIDSPATIAAVTFYAGLVQQHLAPSLSQTQAQGADPFENGLCAMEITGHWSLVGIKASDTINLSDVGVVALPQNVRRVTVIYESGFAVTAHTRHPEAAWLFAQYMSSPYVQIKKAALGIGISGNRAVAMARASSNPLEPAFLRAVPAGIAPWGARVEDYAQVEDIGTEMMQDVLIGGMSPAVALRQAAARIDPELNS
ncbi:MAG: sugar ABC transporter substrate-binding protein [Armatimonadetes bacterium]|nr:sugar ABC transporter substrate-binding protein [Armatimonadota bacterium]MDE2206671.1 sugar ABC transporter substrate-binding protein [Armatimonadota bacterium]